MAALASLYPWIKAAHLIFVIFWIAGLFMLPRLFVYHQEAPVGGPEETVWIDRERKLLKIILAPAIIVVWLMGIALASIGDWWMAGWLHAKLVLVLILSGYHGWAAAYARKLAKGQRPLSGRTLRLLNEVPGIAVAIIVILVIVQPQF